MTQLNVFVFVLSMSLFAGFASAAQTDAEPTDKEVIVQLTGQLYDHALKLDQVMVVQRAAMEVLLESTSTARAIQEIDISTFEQLENVHVDVPEYRLQKVCIAPNRTCGYMDISRFHTSDPRANDVMMAELYYGEDSAKAENAAKVWRMDGLSDFVNEARDGGLSVNFIEGSYLLY